MLDHVIMRVHVAETGGRRHHLESKHIREFKYGKRSMKLFGLAPAPLGREKTWSIANEGPPRHHGENPSKEGVGRKLMGNSVRMRRGINHAPRKTAGMTRSVQWTRRHYNRKREIEQKIPDLGDVINK